MLQRFSLESSLMEEVNKFCELLMFLHPPWKVISVSCQEGGEDRSPGRVTIEMAYQEKWYEGRLAWSPGSLRREVNPPVSPDGIYGAKGGQ